MILLSPPGWAKAGGAGSPDAGSAQSDRILALTGGFEHWGKSISHRQAGQQRAGARSGKSLTPRRRGSGPIRIGAGAPT
ncbi:MAG: hypothetical protein KME26_33100 [Oscillatoria princeps RMCB-10]|nr:hypothetical protein [Oscillatoria princeps RMCB-10]